SPAPPLTVTAAANDRSKPSNVTTSAPVPALTTSVAVGLTNSTDSRSEERRVGKENHITLTMSDYKIMDIKSNTYKQLTYNIKDNISIHKLLNIIFFFQAEDGIRDFHVTGVQTCALPIFRPRRR